MTIRRRDFIKNAVVGAGLIGTGMLSGPAGHSSPEFPASHYTMTIPFIG
jgi:hypothetical protein